MSEAATPPGDSVRPKRRIDATYASITFAVVLTCTIIVLTAVVLIQNYREQFARAETAASSYAQIVAVHTQWLVEASQQVLRRIDDTIDDSAFRPDLATFGDINDQLSGLPGYARITVYGPLGNVRLSNATEPETQNVANEDFFRRAQSGDEVMFSPMRIGSEGPEFTIARRLEQNGAFLGVAAIAVTDSMFGEIWQSLNLDPGSTISIVRDDGWLVARYPAADAPVDLSQYELFTRYLAEAPAGTYIGGASPVDGHSRTVGYYTIPDLPLIAIAGISNQGLVERFFRNAALGLALIVPGLLALLVALWWIVRILHRSRLTHEKLAIAHERNQELFREIHHRVKNNLQAVSSLVQLQPVSQSVKAEMRRRISAMVAVHEHIYRTDQFGTAEVSLYIDKLVADIVTGFDTRARIETDFDTVYVHRDHLMPLGLIVNELVCNAIKYAFPDGQDGTLTVTLKRQAEESACLTISDNGQGFDPDVPSDGMGRRLTQGFAQQLGGTLHVDSGPDGSKFELVFPCEACPETFNNQP